ncbi:YwaF family protein [Mycoplasma simbae]|uniref:YwaF family protein n=1 Tax=Mycoplasma simbae TaxID=36744 RepID=UPI0004978B35|nr:YwaF family protein [Mycoplasma simbae]
MARSRFHEFFRWQGEDKLFYFEGVSLGFYIGCVALAFVALILMWFFKHVIRNWFNSKKTHLRVFKQKGLFRLIGSIIILFMILRSLVLSIGRYPSEWEILPFHLCRLMLVFTALSLIFDAPQLVKYFGAIGMLGAIVALVKPDLSFAGVSASGAYRVGLDSIYFYDYILIHTFLLLGIAALFIVRKIQFRAKDLLITLIFFTLIAIVMFFVNWVTFVYAPDNWKTNYFFLGKDEVNTQKDVFGPLSHWPYNLLSWTFAGWVLATIASMIWMLQDKVYFNRINGKWVFKIQKSNRWKEFISSFKNKVNK